MALRSATKHEAFGEVENSEISVKCSRPSVTRDSSFFGRRERRNGKSHVTVTDNGLPPLRPRLVIDPTVPALTQFSVLVGGIFRSIPNPQLASSIVQRITTSMVNNFTQIASENQPVHGHHFLPKVWDAAGSSVKTTSVVPSSVPVPLHEPFVIPFINDGIQTLRQRNFPARFAIYNFHLADGWRASSKSFAVAAEWSRARSILPTAGTAVCWILGVSTLSRGDVRSVVATITKRLRGLFMQVRHSIPRYCVRRGAALNYPSILSSPGCL